MKHVFVAGLKITAESKSTITRVLEERLVAGQKTLVVTPYSEFLVASMKDTGVKEALNKADIAIADGISIQWAATLLAKPLKAKFYLFKVFEAVFEALYLGLQILISPQKIRTIIPEKIVGADFIFDLAALAAKNNWSMHLLGGYGDTTSKAAAKLTTLHPELKITTSTKNPGDPSVFTDLEKIKPDMLLLAYGPIKQEKWLVDHWSQLPIKMGIGLGGTFDYIAGAKKLPPRIVRDSGLEWLWRLLTQPARFKRIWQGTWGLFVRLVRYRVFSSLEFRPNAVAVIINADHKLLLGLRSPIVDKIFPHHDKKYEPKSEHWEFPQGGKRRKESPEQAALREAKEETGLSDLEFILTSKETHTYEWNLTERSLFRSWPYRGQHQNVVYLYCPHAQSVSMQRTEFSNSKWVNIEELISTVHPLRRKVAEIVTRDWAEVTTLVKAAQER